MRAIIFDTETTGIGEQDQVIELAWLGVHFHEGELRTCGSYTARFSASIPISYGAMGTHHILPHEIEDLPPFDKKHILECDLYIGHKVDFDIGMCKLGTVPFIDTLAIARKLWPKEAHNLSALSYMIAQQDNVALAEVRETIKGAHSAMADVGLCFNLLSFVCEKHGITSMSQLKVFADECLVPDYMAFGKYKGQHISTVDYGYRAWYRKQADVDQYLLKAFDLHPYAPGDVE